MQSPNWKACCVRVMVFVLYCVCSAMMFSITGHNTVIVTGFGEHAGGERAYVLRGIILSSSAVSFLNVVQFGQYLYAQKFTIYATKPNIFIFK